MGWKTHLFRVTAWSGRVGRSFPQRVDLVEAKTYTTAMKIQRQRDPSITPGQQSAGRRMLGCERYLWLLGTKKKPTSPR